MKYMCWCSCLNRWFSRSDDYRIANYDTIMKENVKSLNKKKEKIKDLMGKYTLNHFEITESLIYYLSNTGSVEIRTKFGLRKIYFRIPSSIIALNQSISRKIIEEMTETKQQEAIKSICFKALLIKERIGGSKSANNFFGVGRYLMNNISKLSDFMFFMLILYLVFEIAYKVNGSSFFDVATNFTNALIFILSLIIFWAFFMDSYQVKKHKLKTLYIFKHKSKNVRGSLGFSAFPRSINNEVFKDEQKELGNQTTEVQFRCGLSLSGIKGFIMWILYSKEIRILYYMLIDKTNLINLFLVLIIIISLSGYSQILRGILFLRLARIDSRRILRIRWLYYNTVIGTSILILIAISLFAYIFSLAQLYYESSSHISPEYTVEYWSDFWTWVGAVMDNGIHEGSSSVDELINFLLFIIIMVSSSSIILNILMALMTRLQIAESGSKVSIESETCLVCGKHRAEFDLQSGKSDDDPDSVGSTNTGSNWTDHISKEHNIIAYFYYIIYISGLKESECDGIELEVSFLKGSLIILSRLKEWLNEMISHSYPSDKLWV